MKTLTIPMSKSARRFGYITWGSAHHVKMLKFLGEKENVPIILNALYVGQKKVDWGYRRISIGPKKTNALLPETCTQFVLKWKGDYLQVDGK